jgi:hypothetical protein
MKRNKTNRHLSLLVALLTIGLTGNSSLFAQARIQSRANGAWNSAGTWVVVSGSSSTGVPGANDTAIVNSGTAVTIGASNADCATLLIDQGASLLIDGSGNVRINANPGSATINGTVAMTSSGRLVERGNGTRSLVIGSGGKVTMSGSSTNLAFDSYAFDPASTFEYTAAGNQDVLSGVVFGNLTLGGSGTKTVTPIPIDTVFRCAGKLTVASEVTFDVSTSILRIYLMGDVENSGTLDASVGITVLWMSGRHWVNNGSYLPSTTPGFGYTPTTTFINTEISGTPVSQKFYDVVIDGTTTACNDLLADRHITIAPGAIFCAGTGLTHALGGDWTNSGTFDCGTSTVRFKGTIAEKIGPSVFYNLTVDNSAGVTLTGDVSIVPGGVLTLANGSIATGSNLLSINSTDAGALVPGSGKIVGTVSRAIAPGSTGTYAFFGANAFVVPGGIDNPGTIVATVYPNTNPANLSPAADTSEIAKRYYSFFGTDVGPGFTYTVRLSYEPSEVRGAEANYVLWGIGGGAWQNLGSAGPADTVNNWVAQTGLTAFGGFAIAENSSSLPTLIDSFNAVQHEGSTNVDVTWSTASETNNQGFYVQRSRSSTAAFADLPGSFVPGAGSSSSPLSYGWTDQNGAPGTYFYRLRQVDLSGTVRYSQAVEVVVQITTGIETSGVPDGFSLAQNYPNPFNPATRIQFSVAETKHTTLVVYDILGKEVATLFAEPAQAGTRYTVTFDGSSRPSGTYFCRLVSGGKTTIRKMVLLK